MNGKEKCKMLKQFRAQIAKDNGIDGYEYKECTSPDECVGTCPACDEECRSLELALRSKNVYMNIPRYNDMPDSLVDVMDFGVYKDMKEICEPWMMDRCDYEKIENGRIVIRNPEKAKLANMEAKKRWAKRKDQPVMGLFVQPETDFDKLESELAEKEKKTIRKANFENSRLGKIRGLLKKDSDSK